MTIAVHQPRSCTQPRGGFAPKKSKGLTSCVNNRKLGEDFMLRSRTRLPFQKAQHPLLCPVLSSQPVHVEEQVRNRCEDAVRSCCGNAL